LQILIYYDNGVKQEIHPKAFRLTLKGYRQNEVEYLHFILTISLEECQTKSFGMNLFKFCTTKRLFKYYDNRWRLLLKPVIC